jgi:uncharacterized protein with von Willebrand factor type A (vWA) domain
MGVHMHIHSKEKAPRRELVELCDVALSLVDERGKLLKLLRTNTVRKERADVFNSRLKRLKDLERISHQVQLAFRTPVRIEDGRGGIEAIREEELRALVLHGASAVGQQSAGPIVHGDGRPSPHNPLGEKSEPKARAAKGGYLQA